MIALFSIYDSRSLLVSREREKSFIASPDSLPLNAQISLHSIYFLPISSALFTAPSNPSTSSNLTLLNPRSSSSFPPLTQAFLDNGLTLISFQPLNNRSTFSSGVDSSDEEGEDGGVRQRTQIAS